MGITKEEDHPVYIRAIKFIHDEFISSEETGKKTSAEKVVAKMRVLWEESGKKVFIPKDYLSVDQVTSMFSRLAAKKKKKQLTEPTEQTTKNDNQQKNCKTQKADDEENYEEVDESDEEGEEENMDIPELPGTFKESGKSSAIRFHLYWAQEK